MKMWFKGDYSLAALRREYEAIAGDSTSVSREINQKIYERRAYDRKRAQQRAQKEQRWRDDLQAWLRKLEPPSPPEPSSIIERAEELEELGERLAETPPNQAAGAVKPGERERHSASAMQSWTSSPSAPASPRPARLN